jgi:hypothetical protein
VENVTPWAGTGAVREQAVRRALVGVHSMLGLRLGRFLSLMDPPEFGRAAAKSCVNRGAWPVLMGGSGEDDLVLSAPITLSDYPEVAAESEGDFCDATEIDEILALRVMTLTDEEKAEARGTDPRAAEIIDRCDGMPAEIFERLHGGIRYLGASPGAGAPPVPAGKPEVAAWWDPVADASVDPWTDRVMLDGADVGKGTRVRLSPRRGGDAQDIFLAGRTATVEGVFFDVDGDVHLAVTLDDDPAAEIHQAHGRYRYFRPEEIEVLAEQ